MRIISQDGEWDFPYEISTVRMCAGNDNKHYWIAVNSNCIDSYWNFAVYSSKQKAQKAMDMLREFRTLKSVEGIPLTKAMDETFFNSIEKYFDYYVRSNKKEDILVLDFVKICDYFQFPTDEDVEV